MTRAALLALALACAPAPRPPLPDTVGTLRDLDRLDARVYALDARATLCVAGVEGLRLEVQRARGLR